jgi:hypothetical protein
MLLSACGGKEPDAAPDAAAQTSDAAAPAAEPEEEVDPVVKYPANIDPSKIHPGSLNSDEDTSDRWYPNGDTSSEICFTLTQTSKQDDCVGLAFCQYKVLNGQDDDLIDLPLRDGGNGHAITNEFTFMKDKSVTYDYDFTFQDNFTCYDFKTGTVWKRCHPDFGCKDQSWWDSAFAGLVAYRDLSSTKYQQIVMNEDGTFVESVTGMDDMYGHWEVQAANVLMLIYDNPEDSGIQVVDGGSLLEDGGESGSETTYSDSWQQEFTITADGTVTEFGLYPVYDDDMNLAGYESAFQLTTKANLEALQKEKEEAMAASLAAGSPYPNPEVDDIMDITLDGVNLDQDPDFVWEYIDWDDSFALDHQIKDDANIGMVFELHGHFEGHTFYITTEDGEHKKMVLLWKVGEDFPESDRNCIVKGVLWMNGTNRYIFYDPETVVFTD